MPGWYQIHFFNSFILKAFCSWGMVSLLTASCGGSGAEFSNAVSVVPSSQLDLGELEDIDDSEDLESLEEEGSVEVTNEDVEEEIERVCEEVTKYYVRVDRNQNGKFDEQPIEIMAYENDKSAAENYNFFSWSAHPHAGPSPAPYTSYAYLHRGSDGLSLQLFHNLDNGGSADWNRVDWNLVVARNDMADSVLLSDDPRENRGKLFLQSANEEKNRKAYRGRFNYKLNSDGGVIGPLVTNNFVVRVRQDAVKREVTSDVKHAFVASADGKLFKIRDDFGNNLHFRIEARTQKMCDLQNTEEQYGELECDKGNLLSNGGFEQGDESHIGHVHGKNMASLGSGWDVFSSLPSWTSGEGQGGIEVQGSTVVPAFGGKNYIELDSAGTNSNSSAIQSFASCGGDHMLRFAYRPRSKASPDDNDMEFRVDGKLVGSVEGADHHDEWREYRMKLPGLSAGEHKLEIQATGKENGLGGFVDAVRVRKVRPRARKAGVVTVLLALGDTKNGNLVLPEESTRKIARNAVRFTSKVKRPKVLYVLDSNHRNESPFDTEFITTQLLADFDVTVLREASPGITLNDLDGFNVVWFNNPGYPMGNLQSMQTLLAFDGGVVLSGDDLGRGQGFLTEELTGMVYENNGVNACGQHTDNNKGSAYHVTLGDRLARGIVDDASKNFKYFNDIDHVRLSENHSANLKVMGTWSFEHEGCKLQQPVAVGYKKK